jgi:D-alanyl-lipoteichoic acid acyltransferase DltB (MBOAT superfamily)
MRLSAWRKVWLLGASWVFYYGAWDWRFLFLMIGVFKKTCIADGVTPIVDTVFAAPGNYDTVTVVSAVIFYAMQIYGVFSGYSDMAIATAGLCSATG